MYQNPVLLPQQSNREDLLRTVALYDDDTGEAIDISGRTLAAPGDFTGNAWAVTCGAVVTASATALTIKDYPFGNEMQALALNVGLNLAIAAGSPVTISDVTAKNTMTGYVTSYAPATGALVCQIGASFEFEIRGHSHPHDGGYGASWAIGSGGEGHPIISAQLGNMISVIDLGRIQINIPAAIIAKLHHKTYGEALVMYDGAPSARQIYLGKLPILNGGVSTNPFAAPSSNIYGLP